MVQPVPVRLIEGSQKCEIRNFEEILKKKCFLKTKLYGNFAGQTQNLNARLSINNAKSGHFFRD